jgi:hypothetical protein
MHPALWKGTRKFHYTSNSYGIFCDLNFSSNKNSNGRYDYSKFRKNKIWKKVKSPISMWNGKFKTSKYWGKLQKNGGAVDAPPLHKPQALATCKGLGKY